MPVRISIPAFLSITALLVSCNSRTPSKERFEVNCGIKLPEQFIVKQDEYQDMLQDYVIEYEIEMNSDAMQQVTGRIRNSALYQTDTINGWNRDSVGYHFYSSIDRTNYHAKADTIRNILHYTEAAD